MHNMYDMMYAIKMTILYAFLLPLLFDDQNDENDDDVCIKWSKMLIFFDSANLSIHL